MVRGSSNCQLSEAIQNRAALGWGKVNENISKMPFCHNRKRIVRMIICFEYENCSFEGCCFPCLQQDGIRHKVSISPPIDELTPYLEKLNSYGPTIYHKPFFKICSSDGYDWHDWLRQELRKNKPISHQI